MNYLRNKIVPVLYIVIIAVLAIFMSNQLNTNVISSIQGYRFSGRTATSSNATNSNVNHATNSNATNSNVNHATNSNATNSNVNHATNSNATNSNVNHATNTNATRNNAVSLNLINFDLKRGEAKVGDKIDLTVVASGAVVSRGTIGFTKVNGSGGFTATIEYDTEHNASIKIPTAEAGEYQISYVILGGNTGTGAGFSTTFTQEGSSGTKQFDFKNTLKILPEEDETKIIKIEEFSVVETNAQTGEKVQLKLSTDKSLKKASLILKDSHNEKIRLPIRMVNDHPYVKILSTMKDDTYRIDSLILESNEIITQYAQEPSGTEKNYTFPQEIRISGNSSNTACYNNEDINADIIKLIHDAKVENIEVNADNRPLISDALFSAVKNQDKNLVIEYGDHEWTFKGKDITDPKPISATITTDKIENNADISSLVDSAAIVHFDDNGYLPGKAHVKIKEDEIIEGALNGDNANVYLYNPASDKFIEIATNVTKEDGTYSFDITHNSDYILTAEELSKEMVEEDTGTVVSYVKEKKIYIILLLIGLIVILCAALIVVILRKKKRSSKNSKKEAKKEEPKDQEKQEEHKEEIEKE